MSLYFLFIAALEILAIFRVAMLNTRLLTWNIYFNKQNVKIFGEKSGFSWVKRWLSKSNIHFFRIKANKYQLNIKLVR